MRPICPRRGVLQDRRVRETPPLRQERRVEKARQRCDRAKDREQVAVETVGCRELRVEFAACQKLFEAQVFAGRMILQVSAWNARQSLAFECADRLAKGLPGDDSMKRAMIRGDVLAYRPQIRRRGHIDSAANPDPPGRDLEVQAGALMAGEASGWKVRGDVRLEWSLVRAEARVAVNPVQGHTWVGDELGRKRRQVTRQSSKQIRHRSPDVLLVLRFPALEPLAVVVAFQCAEK